MKPTQAQQRAINSDSKNILLVAGAGSGKTATVVQRISRLLKDGVRPSSILCLTFTRKAALELKERIAKNAGESAARKMWVGTFHSISYRMLMQWGRAIGYQTHDKAITVVTPAESEMLLKEIAKSYDYKNPFVRITEAKATLAHDGIWPECLDLKRIIQEYQGRLKECNAVDFDSLLLEVTKLFEASPAALEHYQKQFDYIFVDEYQDTDRIQYNLHELLNPKNLFVVGDSDQSLYSWRGARIDIILGFEKDHPGAEVIKLEECFRCGDIIVERSNALIKHNQNRIDKTLNGATGREGVFDVSFDNSSAGIANYLAEYLAFENPSEIAVIARTHDRLERIEIACQELGLEVLRVGKATNDIESDDTFKFLHAYLRLRANPRDNIAFLTANAIGLKANLKEVWQAANELGCGWFECCSDTFMFVSTDSLCIADFYEACCESHDLQASVQVKEFLSENWPDLTASEWLQEYQLKDNQMELEKENHDKIVLLTGHAAKGLEWQNVLIADFTEGGFPSKRAMKGNIEEERRLAYVAFTRAKERLIVFTNPEKPSRFLEEAGHDINQLGRVPLFTYLLSKKTGAGDALEKAWRDASRFGRGYLECGKNGIECVEMTEVIVEPAEGNKIAVVDIETTGFMPNGLIVEVGIAELDLDTGEIRPLYNELVKEPGFCEDHKDSWVFNNSDLTFEEVDAAEPLDVFVIQTILMRYKATAFNKKFDFSFFKSRGLVVDELDCIMLLATDVCKIPGKYGRNKCPTVEEAWRVLFPEIPYTEKHRGLDDAIHEAQIAYELYARGVLKISRS